MFRPSAKPVIGPERARWRHSGHTPRRNAGLAAYENVLARAGLSPVAGVDEAGRGACAGPLVVAAVVLDCATIRRIPGLADSKLLTPEERETIYGGVLRWALDWHVVTIPPHEVDALGLHVCNVEGMRRALAGLRHRPGYVLTDGFPVRGLGTPALAVWKGDQVTASVAAASVVAKVTRDRMMVALDGSYPAYGFARHKGYSTPEHMTALCAWGPCPEHRYSYTNVLHANRRWATGWLGEAADLEAAPFADDDDLPGVAGPAAAEMTGEAAASADDDMTGAAAASADDDMTGEGAASADDEMTGEGAAFADDDLPGEGAAPASAPAGELAPGKLTLGNGTEAPDAWADLGAAEAAAAAASRAIPVGADAPGGGE
ncbi:MAG: ribonuclease HII [Streptosporangiaceae bacterium]